MMMNCPQMTIRSLMLRTRRAQKLTALWAAEDRLDYALMYVLQCLQDHALTFDPDINIAKTHEELRIELFIGPVAASLTNRFHGTVSFGSLRWLLRSRASAGVIRTILLWILQRWRSFTRPHHCLKCASLFMDQDHISRCCDIPVLLMDHPELVGLDLSATSFSPTTAIESSLNIIRAATMDNQQTQTQQLLLAVVDVIRTALVWTFGAPSTNAIQLSF